MGHYSCLLILAISLGRRPEESKWIFQSDSVRLIPTIRGPTLDQLSTLLSTGNLIVAHQLGGVYRGRVSVRETDLSVGVLLPDLDGVEISDVQLQMVNTLLCCYPLPFTFRHG